jgi:hypothetical protein
MSVKETANTPRHSTDNGPLLMPINYPSKENEVFPKESRGQRGQAFMSLVPLQWNHT